MDERPAFLDDLLDAMVTATRYLLVAVCLITAVVGFGVAIPNVPPPPPQPVVDMIMVPPTGSTLTP